MALPAVLEGIGAVTGFASAGFDLLDAIFGNDDGFNQEEYLQELERINEEQRHWYSEQKEKERNTRPRYWSPTQEQLEDIDDAQFRATVMADAYHRSRLVEKQVDDLTHRFAHRAREKAPQWRNIAEESAERIYPFLRYEESPMYQRDLYQNQPVEEIFE